MTNEMLIWQDGGRFYNAEPGGDGRLLFMSIYPVLDHDSAMKARDEFLAHWPEDGPALLFAGGHNPVDKSFGVC